MSWDTISKAWADVWASAEKGWAGLYDQAVKTWEGAIRQEPQAYAPKVEAWVTEMNAARVNLDHMKALLPSPPMTDADRAAHEHHRQLEQRYHELAAAFYADAQPLVTQGDGVTSPAPSVGFVPILAAAGLAVGVGATSWAVAAYEYAANLREQTALASQELEARVEVSKAGRTLQATTLPALSEPSLPTVNQGKKGLLLLGGLAAISAAVALPILLKRS